METRRTEDGTKIILNVTGEIDGTNVGDFESEIKRAVEDSEQLIVDLDGLEYVSSAGLRVFLMAQKQVKQNGHDMVITNVCDDVMDIFKVTDFVKLLNIE